MKRRPEPEEAVLEEEEVVVVAAGRWRCCCEVEVVDVAGRGADDDDDDDDDDDEDEDEAGVVAGLGIVNRMIGLDEVEVLEEEPLLDEDLAVAPAPDLLSLAEEAAAATTGFDLLAAGLALGTAGAAAAGTTGRPP